MTGILLRTGNFDSDTQKEEGRVKTEAEIRDTLPQSQEKQEARRDFSLECPANTLVGLQQP